MQDGRIPILINSAAGLGRRRSAGPVQDALERAGVPARIRTVGPGEIEIALEEECATQNGVIGVAGGDGTLLAAASRLAGSDLTLAPLPTGTLNHFARRLGLADLDTSAQALRAGTTRRVPLGIVDDRVFLNTATFGFYADVVRRRERYRRFVGKWGAALVAFAVTLSRTRLFDVSLQLEGERLERTTSLVWVGIGRGSFPLVHESPDRRRAPELEIVIFRAGSMAGSIGLLLRTLLRLRTRRAPAEDPALEVLHARQLLIQGRHQIGVTLDGEVFRCEPPILIAVQDDALSVRIPGSEPLHQP